MKIFTFLILFAVSAFAQVFNPNPIVFPGIPSGNCSAPNTAVNTSNGDFYTCSAGSWVKVGSSGGGTIPALGVGQIIAGTSGTPIAQFKPDIDVRDYGVDCTGVTPSTTQVLAAITAARGTSGFSGKVIGLADGNGCTINLGTTQLVIKNFQGLHIDLGGSQGNDVLKTGFVWHGAKATPAIVFDQVRDATLENFYVYCPAACDAPMVFDTLAPITNITSHNLLRNVTIFEDIQNSSQVGLNICPTAPGNCEDMIIDRFSMICPGPAATANNKGTAILWPGGNAQPFGSAVTNPEIAGCSRAIDVENANILRIIGGLFESNYTDIYAGAGRGIYWGYTRSEQSVNQVMLDNSVSDFHADHISFAGLTGGSTTFTYLQTTGGTRLKLSNIDWDNVAVTPVAGPTSGNSAALESENNNYPNGTTCPTWGQFGHGAVSINDNCTNVNGLLRTMTSDRELEAISLPSTGTSISVRSPTLTLQGANFGIGADASLISHLPFANSSGSYLAISHPYTTTFAMSPPAFVGGTSVSQVTTPTLTTVTTTGTPGGTSYTYKIVATDGVGGTTPASAGVAIATGNATLSGNNCNRLNWFENSGAYKYLIYRTASGGTPSSVGLIATVWPSQETPTGYFLSDCGLTGDTTIPPTTNTTGQVTSTVPTGLAPFVITSTTPVANLTTVPATYNHSGTQQTAAHIVQDSCTLGTDCAVTLTGASVYTSSTSYTCVCEDDTAIAACKVAQSSGSAFTVTGTGTDAIRYVCVGN
jgi:hypothetical protein